MSKNKTLTCEYVAVVSYFNSGLADNAARALYAVGFTFS